MKEFLKFLFRLDSRGALGSFLRQDSVFKLAGLENPIISFPFLGVRQGPIGFIDLAEQVGRGFASLIGVGMKALGQAAVGGLDPREIGILGDAEE